MTFSYASGVGGEVMGGGEVDTTQLASQVVVVRVKLQSGMVTPLGGIASSTEMLLGGWHGLTHSLAGAHPANGRNHPATHAGIIHSRTSLSCVKILVVARLLHLYSPTPLSSWGVSSVAVAMIRRSNYLTPPHH